MQQWYQHYQAAQAHTYSTAAPQDSTATDYSKEHAQVHAQVHTQVHADLWSTFSHNSYLKKDG